MVFGACKRQDFLPGLGDADSSELTPAGEDDPTNELTPYDSIMNYNNFYEFTTEKEDVAHLAQDFKTSPWVVEVGGLVNKPQTFDMDDLQRKFGQEERIYRMRCVEGWSMVIPWAGFPLAELLKEVEPTPQARYVRFETLYDSDPARRPES